MESIDSRISGDVMKAICPLHGATTIVRTNAYGFPVYACCCDDVPYDTPPDACTRAPTQRGAPVEPQENVKRKTPRE
jgi:hypothetical protein